MSSPAENQPSPTITPPDGRSVIAVCEKWNRKLHFYSGLFLIVFLWLFAFTGLLLNHPTWRFHESWQNRHETKYQLPIVAPADGLTGDLDQARELMRQMSIDGEILWTTTRTDGSPFEFQVRSPRHFYFIKADVAQGRADIRHASVNAWGIAKILHTFTGNYASDPRNRRDWALTAVWAYSMDFVAAGLIFMVFSSIYLWLKQPQKLLAGGLCLALGTFGCILFCFGLRWISGP
ncbi:MAG TPA: hypothetical protein VM680_02570 [Verrucomicrobiae bacterium]|nr:hypothetical protein [Verrucomicrobiae bacterium]